MNKKITDRTGSDKSESASSGAPTSAQRPLPRDEIDATPMYARWKDKPEPRDGIRLTIMTAKTRYASSETICVHHAVEFVDPGHWIHISGPKPVYGERVNGTTQTSVPPHYGECFAPLLYDGPILPSPGLDLNYEVSRYSLPPGVHEIVWETGGFRSNSLRILVED